eukprot:scaffold34704_cov162-Amphora_coffeaeformis.AAC.1
MVPTNKTDSTTITAVPWQLLPVEEEDDDDEDDADEDHDTGECGFITVFSLGGGGSGSWILLWYWHPWRTGGATNSSSCTVTPQRTRLFRHGEGIVNPPLRQCGLMLTGCRCGLDAARSRIVHSS